MIRIQEFLHFTFMRYDVATIKQQCKCYSSIKTTFDSIEFINCVLESVYTIFCAFCIKKKSHFDFIVDLISFERK